MVRDQLRSVAEVHINEAAEDAYNAYVQQEKAQQRRDLAAQDIRRFVAALAAPVMQSLRGCEDLEQGDYASLQVEDPERILPGNNHPKQPGAGEGILALDITVGDWDDDGAYRDFVVRDVLPWPEGEPAEITAVGVRGYWRLVEPTTHQGTNDWGKYSDAEVFGYPNLAEVEQMPISAPPTSDQREAVGALVRAADEQRKNFADTWAMFEQFRSGVTAQEAQTIAGLRVLPMEHAEV